MLPASTSPLFPEIGAGRRRQDHNLGATCLGLFDWVQPVPLDSSPVFAYSVWQGAGPRTRCRPLGAHLDGSGAEGAKNSGHTWLGSWQNMRFIPPFTHSSNSPVPGLMGTRLGSQGPHFCPPGVPRLEGCRGDRSIGTSQVPIITDVCMGALRTHFLEEETVALGL